MVTRRVGVVVESVERSMLDRRNRGVVSIRDDYELLLVVCKACGLGWVAVRAVLELAAHGRGEFSFNSAGLLDSYNKLSRDSAARVMRFLKVRKAASSVEIKQLLAS
jgi:hypothetical protein